MVAAEKDSFLAEGDADRGAHLLGYHRILMHDARQRLLSVASRRAPQVAKCESFFAHHNYKSIVLLLGLHHLLEVRVPFVVHYYIYEGGWIDLPIKQLKRVLVADVLLAELVRELEQLGEVFADVGHNVNDKLLRIVDHNVTMALDLNRFPILLLAFQLQSHLFEFDYFFNELAVILIRLVQDDVLLGGEDSALNVTELLAVLDGGIQILDLLFPLVKLFLLFDSIVY